jgi:hypothetical protein
VSDTPGYLSAARGRLYAWMKANPNATLKEKREKAAHLGLR